MHSEIFFQTLFDFKRLVSHSISPKYSGKIPYVLSKPRICFLGSKDNEPFSTADRSERVENFLFRATREYTEAGIEQAIVAMRRLGANSPELRKRAVRE